MVNSRDFVGALEKGLQIIEAFDSDATMLTLSDVAAKIGITRAAARRFLLTLTELGYAQHDGRRFSLTPKVICLSRVHLNGNSIVTIAQPVLQAIAEKTMESVSAGVLTAADVVFVARAQSPRPVSIHIATGTRVPAFCSAMGRVLLAELKEEVVRELLTQFPPDKMTSKTKIALKDVLAEIRKTRAQGFGTSIEDLEIGLNSIAVPVRNTARGTTFALGLSVSANRMSAPQMVQSLLPTLASAATALESMP
jgi:IclR family pca regulon transcriptional regulator